MSRRLATFHSFRAACQTSDDSALMARYICVLGSRLRERCQEVSPPSLCPRAYATRMLQCLDAQESQEVREFLRDSGYTTQTLKARFGHNDIPQLHLLK